MTLSSHMATWTTPKIKVIPGQKRRAFRSVDKEELNRVQRELRRLIEEGKDS